MSTATGPKDLIAGTRKHFADGKSGDMTISIVVNNAYARMLSHNPTTRATDIQYTDVYHHPAFSGVAGNRFVLSSIDSESNDSGMIADFEKQYRTNVLGPLLLLQSALPYLPTNRSGRIINLSSVSSSLGFPGQSIYGGTKAALEAMTRTWARELSERCTVNAVNPGPVDTDMYKGVDKDFESLMLHWNSVTPGAQIREGKGGDPESVVKMVKAGNEGRGLGGRAATVDEIAGVVGMLCSEESG